MTWWQWLIVFLVVWVAAFLTVITIYVMRRERAISRDVERTFTGIEDKMNNPHRNPYERD